MAWIWLQEEKFDSSPYSFFDKQNTAPFCVAAFTHTYPLQDAISAEISICADTRYRLYGNGRLLGMGPAYAGGDFELQQALPWYYEDHYTQVPLYNTLELCVQVCNRPLQMCEFSSGKAGLSLSLRVTYKDGSEKSFETDESWLGAPLPAYTDSNSFDAAVQPVAMHGVRVVSHAGEKKQLALKPLQYELLLPTQKQGNLYIFDRIYSGYLQLCVHTSQPCTVTALCGELPDALRWEYRVHTERDITFLALPMNSIGAVQLHIEGDAQVQVQVLYSHYPAENKGCFTASDPALTQIYDVCLHTLQICRQSMHLDSPLHMEPLACTGDYLVETMMTAFTLCDMSLCEADVRRTAALLEYRDGVMFHTTYSLLWVTMLYNVYQFTGSTELIRDCMPALEKLLRRFENYNGANGLLDNPPDYMFVDWRIIDGFELHHPPKALGQTVLNAFYCGALQKAALLYDCVGKPHALHTKAQLLIQRMNELLYDPQTGLYFDGLNTPAQTVNRWQPENTDKRYYSVHSNALCALYGICSEPKALMQRTMQNPQLLQPQPYFLHFVLDALYENGLFAQYGMQQIMLWKQLTAQCSKGLAEGLYKPNETYRFDYSHAWGGTPAYQLVRAFLGFEMLEPGFKKIALSPCSFGQKEAFVRMPTPFGDISCRFINGQACDIQVPGEISAVIAPAKPEN